MRTRERRGSIVVLVALLMVVLLGVGAFAVDVSQMQAYRSELRRTADAAALAATLQLLDETPALRAAAPLFGQSLVDSNPVMGQVATPVFEIGRYIAPNFIPTTDMDVVDAVRVTVTGSGRFHLAQFFRGDSLFDLRAEAIAWLPISATPCAAPWAILQSAWPLQLPSSGQPSKSSLRNQPQIFIVKHLDLGGHPDSAYGPVNIPPFPADSGDGIDNYALNVALKNGCHRLANGDSLQAKITGYNAETISGASSGGGLINLCAPLSGNTCYGINGQVGPAVRIPIVSPVAHGECATRVIYDEDQLSTGGVICYEVIDVGTFVVLTATQGAGEVGQVRAAYAGQDTIGPVRGYAQRPILVQ